MHTLYDLAPWFRCDHVQEHLGILCSKICTWHCQILMMETDHLKSCWLFYRRTFLLLFSTWYVGCDPAALSPK